MGLRDRLGTRSRDGGRWRHSARGERGWDQAGFGALGGAGHGRDPDDVMIERYRYLLGTAPSEAVEQAHAEAFAQSDSRADTTGA
jgi:hypothetical protein